MTEIDFCMSSKDMLSSLPDMTLLLAVLLAPAATLPLMDALEALTMAL
jgi:hypothetical protein